MLLSCVPTALPDTQLGAGSGHDLAETINEFSLGGSAEAVRSF
jgi:hypothetical protein